MSSLLCLLGIYSLFRFGDSGVPRISIPRQEVIAISCGIEEDKYLSVISVDQKGFLEEEVLGMAFEK